MMTEIIGIEQESNLRIYKHKKFAKYIFLPPFGKNDKSLWKMKKRMQVNPEVMNKMSLFLSLTVDDQHIMNEIKLNAHVRKFLNRINSMLRMRAKRAKRRFHKPIWITRIEFGDETGRIHVHFMTNYHFLNYLKRKKLDGFIERTWELGRINHFTKLYDDSGKFKAEMRRKVFHYIRKYMYKNNESKMKTKTKITYNKLYTFSREFIYEYEPFFRSSSEAEMNEEKGLDKYFQLDLSEIDYNPLHHRVIKNPHLFNTPSNKKLPFLDPRWLYPRWKGSRKYKNQLYLESHKFLDLNDMKIKIKVKPKKDFLIDFKYVISGYIRKKRKLLWPKTRNTHMLPYG